MDVIKGKKIEKIDEQTLLGLAKGFGKIVVDIGTGDGRFVFKNALNNPENLYIGIDPAEKQLQVSSRDIQRKKLNNALLAVGSVEQLPNELKGLADEIYINFPWGSLLETFAKPIVTNTSNVLELLKTGGSMRVIFGYDEKFEPSETQRLQLPTIDLNYIENILVPKYRENGFNITKYGRFDTGLEKVETTWKKRLKDGKREWFFLVITG